MIPLIISHSEKGGTCKSTLSGLVLELAIRNGLRPYLIEGDTGVPDVAAKYRDHVPGVQIPLQRADAADAAVVALFNQLETLRNNDEMDVIVINMPAGASATIDSRAKELLAPTAEALGMEIVTMYGIGPGQETVNALQNSLEEGLCSVSKRMIAVPNHYLGDGIDHFEWMSSAVRDDWFEQGGMEYALPVLMPSVRDQARKLPGTLYQLADGCVPGLTVIERSILFRWLNHSQVIANVALGTTHSKCEAA